MFFLLLNLFGIIIKNIPTMNPEKWKSVCGKFNEQEGQLRIVIAYLKNIDDPRRGMRNSFGIKFEPFIARTPIIPYKPKDAPAIISVGKKNASARATIILTAKK